MKKFLCILLAVAGLMSISNNASAKGIPIFYNNGLTFSQTHQLPDSIIIDGQHVNFGVGFNQFGVFWVPLWNYGETEYVLITDDGNTGYDLDEEELAYLKEEYQIDTEQAPAIPFWHKTGGKLIWGGVLLLIIGGYFRKSKTGGEEETAQPTA